MVIYHFIFLDNDKHEDPHMKQLYMIHFNVCLTFLLLDKYLFTNGDVNFVLFHSGKCLLNLRKIGHNASIRRYQNAALSRYPMEVVLFVHLIITEMLLLELFRWIDMSIGRNMRMYN